MVIPIGDIDATVNRNVSTRDLEDVCKHDVAQVVASPPVGRVEPHVIDVGKVDQSVGSKLHRTLNVQSEVLIICSHDAERGPVRELQVVDLKVVGIFAVDPNVCAAIN